MLSGSSSSEICTPRLTIKPGTNATATADQPAASTAPTLVTVNKPKDSKSKDDDGKATKKKSKKHCHHVKKSIKSSNGLTDSDDSDSDSEAPKKKKKRRTGKSKKLRRSEKGRKDDSSSSDSDTSSSDDDAQSMSKQLAEMTKQVAALTTAINKGKGSGDVVTTDPKDGAAQTKEAKSSATPVVEASATTPVTTTKLGYKRVDRVWDSTQKDSMDCGTD